MAAAIYSTVTQEGIDINNVFYLDTKTYPEYPAPPFLAGELAWGTDGSEFVYSTASITIAAGSAVLLSQVPGSWSVALAGGATIATPPTGQLLGIVGGTQGTLVVGAPSGTQTASYFWVQRAGNAQDSEAIAASTTKNAQLYSSATTAGILSSSAGGTATTYQVNGIVISQATGSAAGPNTATLNYPVVGATD